MKWLCRAFQMSMPDIRLASFVVFLYLQVTVIVCKNAAISGCADSQLVDSSLTLKCEYTGKGDVVAIYWFNGSNSDILTLRPGYNVPHCDVFSRMDISFDPHRINYTCNALSNVYTLTINPLQKLDNNVTWSCTFLDPAPDPVKAECIVHLSDNTDDTAGDDRNSSYVSTVTIVMVLCISLITVLIIIILWIRRRNICFICCYNAEVHEVEHHRNEEPNLASTQDEEDPYPLLATELSTKQDGHNREQYAGVSLSLHPNSCRISKM